MNGRLKERQPGSHLRIAQPGADEAGRGSVIQASERFPVPVGLEDSNDAGDHVAREEAEGGVRRQVDRGQGLRGGGRVGLAGESWDDGAARHERPGAGEVRRGLEILVEEAEDESAVCRADPRAAGEGVGWPDCPSPVE
jgi:hypothetical protein